MQNLSPYKNCRPYSQDYSSIFQVSKTQKEKKKSVKFISDNREEYNLSFSLSELKHVLQKCNDSAVGLADIHYKQLTNLPESSLSFLLTVFNSIWESGIFPPSWREATTVAIPKPGKDPSDPNNY